MINPTLYNLSKKESQTAHFRKVKSAQELKPVHDWIFDWGEAFRDIDSEIYLLKSDEIHKHIQGAVQLKIREGMMVMELLELAPHNIGKFKLYDRVAGCLIAFACRESFKLESNYKGFLTFITKSELKDWYITKYGATCVSKQRMYIDNVQGEILINRYLK